MNAAPQAMAKKIKLGDDASAFDFEYWAQFTPEQRIEATWQAVLDWAQMKGLDETQLRLDRTVGRLKRG